MTAVLPRSRPQLTREDLRARLAPFAVDRSKHPIVVVGIRGYYRDTLGKPGANDRGMYDDAIFLDLPGVTLPFNANTDPSKVREGQGTGPAKGMARLQPGAWFVHRLDLHKGQYLALCQRAGPVTVMRDGDPDYPESGMFGINIHRGGVNGTSSEGCQTIPPAQWPEFINSVTHAATSFFGARSRQAVIPYVLLEDAK